MRLIDADALLRQVIKKKSEIAQARYTEGFNDAILRVRSMIHSAPTIESKASEGRWKGAGMGDYRCSLCDGIVNGKYKFCPYCGDRKEDTA